MILNNLQAFVPNAHLRATIHNQFFRQFSHHIDCIAAAMWDSKDEVIWKARLIFLRAAALRL